MSDALVSQDTYLEVTNQVTGSFAFVAATKKITRASGSWITDGFEVGDRIKTNAPDAGNAAGGTISALTATDMTVSDATFADAAASSRIVTDYIKVGEVISLNTPAGEPAEIDVTHLRSTAREFRNGLRDEGSISGEMNFVPSDRGQLIMSTMQNESTGRTCSITCPAVDDGETQLDGYRWTFTGLVRGMPVAFSVDEKAVRSFTIRVSGIPVEEVIPV